VSASYPLRRSFARIGITYGYDISDIVVKSTPRRNIFEYLYFSASEVPNALNGIHTQPRHSLVIRTTTVNHR